MKYWDKAWTLVDGCTPRSPGCDHCWSAAMTHRFHQFQLLTNIYGAFNGDILTRPDRLEIPLRRRVPTVYQVWNDLFHKDVPPDFINRAYAVMAASPQHTFLVLTKREKRMADFFASRYFPGRFHDAWIQAGGFPLWGEEDAPEWPLPNVWHGLTVCNPDEENKIGEFLRVPGNKFLSIEPMLGPVDVKPYLAKFMYFCPGCDKEKFKDYCKKCGTFDNNPTNYINGILAVIVGGETGPGARPIHPDWARKVRNDCAAAGVSLLFKQWGEWYPDSDLGQIKDTKRPGQCRKGQPSCYAHLLGEAGSSDRETDILMRRVGSKSAGRLLDGREHNDMPWRAS